METADPKHHFPVFTAGEGESMQIRVKGMTCVGCAASLQRVLESHSGVTAAPVSFAAGKAIIEGVNLRSSELIQLIEGRGFGAELIDPDV